MPGHQSKSSDSRLFSFYLSAMHDLGKALQSQQARVPSPRPLRESLYRILGTFAIGRGMLMTWDRELSLLMPAANKGLRGTARMPLQVRSRELKVLVAGSRPFHLHLPPGGLEGIAAQMRPDLDKFRLRLVVPMGTGSAFLGMLFLGDRIGSKPLTELELEVLEEMATLLALRLEGAHLRRELSEQVNLFRRQGRQLRQIYMETIRALAGVIDGPEPDGRPGHSVRVAALASEMGRLLHLPKDSCERLYVAGLLHDIGKQVINRELLGKSELLDADERREIERHPLAACDLISHIRFPWGDVAQIIRHHHERPDGKGYPDRLRGDQISIEARILMMAEAFDSMTSDQPWRPRLALGRIVEQITHNLGLQFEPRVAQALCEVVEAGLNGDVRQPDFIPHLEAAFDPELIREMLGELRRQIARPTLRPIAQVIEATGSSEPGA